MAKRFYKKGVPQNHHLSYEPEVTTKLYREEHYYITMIDRFKPPRTLGFLIALEMFILRNKSRAINLDKEDGVSDKGFHTNNIKKGKAQPKVSPNALKRLIVFVTECPECDAKMRFKSSINKFKCTKCTEKMSLEKVYKIWRKSK